MSQNLYFCFHSLLLLIGGMGYTLSLDRFCICHFSCAMGRRRRFLILFAAALLLPLINAITISGILPSLCGNLVSLLWPSILALWVILLYQGQITAKISAAAILLTLTTLLHPFIGSLFSCIELLCLHAMHIEPSQETGFLLECLFIGITFSCSISAIRCLSGRMDGFFACHTSRWYLVLSAPLFGIIVLWDILKIGASHGILLRGGDYLNLYYNQIFSHTGICLLSALCMGAAGFYIFGMEKIDLEQQKKEQYRSQVNFYQMLEEQYHSLERLRHDMKNHIIGLQRLLDNQEWNQMGDYLHNMAQAGGLECAGDMTGKGIVDALLYYKYTKANHSHIRWECDVHIPPGCPVSDFDLCVIFGNILDNALEACTKTDESKERFIRIHAQTVKKCLFLEAVNNTDISDTHSLKPGIGLQNVKDTINKYNGTLSIDIDGGVFRISVLLPFTYPS